VVVLQQHAVSPAMEEMLLAVVLRKNAAYPVMA
jgi:hypothetical protein